MMGWTRRTFLRAGAALATATIIPELAAAQPVATLAPKAALPAWAVGTPGEWDWRVIRARDHAHALAEWISETIGGNGCYAVEDGEPPENPANCECEWCSAISGIEAERHPEWDAFDVKAGDARWFESGLGAHCSRCSDETFDEECGHVVSGKVVCESCLTIEDLRVIDPERAAEIDDDEQFAPVPGGME